MQNEKRNIIQQTAIKLFHTTDHLLLTWATGCGKSLAALQCAKDGGKWLIVCKEINHIENWRREINKHNVKASIVDIICYASLHKYIDRGDWEINLILDEVHALSELRELRIEAIAPTKIISLSATVDSDIRERLRAIKPFIEYHISTSNAIAQGILPEPKVYIVEKQLNDVRKEYAGKFGKRVIMLTAKEYYNYLSNSVDYWKYKWETEGEDWRYKKFMFAALERKRWISNYKTDTAMEIIGKIWGRRFICFTGSVEQCNKLGGSLVIHNKVAPKKREKLVEDLNEGRINNLFCVNMMKESMNINKIEAGMIVQLDGASDRSFIQTLGRTLRGENPEFYIIVVKGTQDDKYLKTALTNFNKKYIAYVDM